MPDHSEHLSVVVDIKTLMITDGILLVGPCGAFQITRRVAWFLRDEGTGLLAKAEGNNCLGYATDVICYPDGAIVDILGDSGGANTPTWQNRGFVDPALYRPPRLFDDDIPAPPVPAPDSLLARVALLEAQMSDLPRQLNGIRARLRVLELPEPVEISTNRVWGHAHRITIPSHAT